MSRSLSPRATAAAPRWPGRLRSLAFGGDYNPEQWPEDVWVEDVRLMREAGVSMVTVGVFSWALLEPAEGEYDFAWLDRVLELLHDAGILVDLATPTAAPPAWFSRAYPESLPVTVEGVRLGIGARESFCPSSVDYRRAAVRIASALADRYGDHPALALWHVAQRVRRARRPLLLHGQHARRSAAGCASATGRSTRSTTLGHELLGPELRRLGGDHRAAARADAGQPRPAARLPALLLGRVPRVLPARARRPARAVAGRPGDHQLHGHRLPAHRLLALGRRGRRRHQRPLPDRRGPREPRAPGDDRGPLPRARARPLVAAARALDRRRQLAAAQPGQGARRDAPQLAGPRGARLGRRDVLPVARLALRRREVPLGDAPPRRHRQPDLARGGRAGRRRGRAGRAPGHAGARRRGDRVGLGGLVGARAGVPADGRPRLPGADPRVLRGALAREGDGRLRVARRRPLGLPAGRGAEPLHRPRGRSRAT